MKILGLAAAVLLTSAAAQAEWKRPTWKETALIIGAGSLCTIDTLTAIDGSRKGYREKNWTLGASPSTERILVMGSIGISLSVIIWYRLPHPWRSIFSTSIIIIEGYNVHRQFSIGLNMVL